MRYALVFCKRLPKGRTRDKRERGAGGERDLLPSNKVVLEALGWKPNALHVARIALPQQLGEAFELSEAALDSPSVAHDTASSTGRPDHDPIVGMLLRGREWGMKIIEAKKIRPLYKRSAHVR